MKNNLNKPLNDKQITRDKKEECGYRQAMAFTGQMDSFPQERNQAAASPISSIDLIAKQASTTEQTLQELCGRRCDGYNHRGLNE
jgi:hypothetical protein